MLLDPEHRAQDRSAETLAIYQRVLPEREWRALEAWSTTFYPSQRAWVFEPSRRGINCSSRQAGKSHGTAGAAVCWGAFNGELTTIISKGETESIEVLDKVVRHATVLERLGSRMARLKRRSATHVVFESGGRVLAAPSTGGRGFTGNLFLDEIAYHEHAEQTWDAALPVTMRGRFRVRIASTPNGIGNLFHSLWSDPSKRVGYALHEVPLKVAIDEGLQVDLQHCWAAAKGDRRLFDQMFNCRFLDGEQQYIQSQYVLDCQTDNLFVQPGRGEWYAGLDIGRTNDLTVLVVVHFDGSVATVRAVRSVKRTDHDALHGLVNEAFRNYTLRRLCVDATGMGSFPVDEMQRRFGRQAVEGVNFGSAGAKDELATTLYSAFCDKWLRIPKTDAALRDVTPGSADGLSKDVMALRRIIGPSGIIRYDAPHTVEGHADRAWALALALYGIINRPGVRTVHFAGSQL